MIGAISTALSGLMAASKRTEAAASNIANVSTPDYTPVETVQKTSETGGVLAENLPRKGAVANLYGPGVDLAEEAVNLKLAELSYKANIKAMEAAQDMARETMRIFDNKV